MLPENFVWAAEPLELSGSKSNMQNLQYTWHDFVIFVDPSSNVQGCGQLNRPMVLLENVDTAELKVRVSINGWVAFTQHIPRDGQLQREYHSEAGASGIHTVCPRNWG